MYKPVHIERGVQRLADNYVIEMLHITKEFPGIKANDDITLQLRKGEIPSCFFNLVIRPGETVEDCTMAAFARRVLEREAEMAASDKQ